MKREIKFRGRDKKGRGFIYGNLIYDLDPKRVENVMRKAWIREPLGLLGNTIEVDPETVCQYTGLKDKNGVDIYEGDILSYDYGDFEQIKEWMKQPYVYILYQRGFYCGKGLYKKVFLHGFRFKYTEVIGNIHDNPELLTKEEKEE